MPAPPLPVSNTQVTGKAFVLNAANKNLPNCKITFQIGLSSRWTKSELYDDDPPAGPSTVYDDTTGPPVVAGDPEEGPKREAGYLTVEKEFIAFKVKTRVKIWWEWAKITATGWSCITQPTPSINVYKPELP